MKTFILSLSFALLLCGGGALYLATFTDSLPGAMEEGYGVNPSSRRYFEYLRHRDPSTGEIPRDMHLRVREYTSRLPHKEYDRSLNWIQRGPINKGGRSRALALDIQDENIILAGSVSGGMWRSANGGQTWTKTTAPSQIHTTSCVIQDIRPGHEDTWYMGTGEEFYGIVSGTSFVSLYSGDGIFKSTDNGQSWQQLTSTASGTPQNVMQNGSYDFIWNMAIDYSNLEQDEVYASVYNGIIRSVDGGETWSQVLGFTAAASQYVDVVVNEDGVVYAYMSFGNGANPRGVYRSPDGINWTEITPDGWYDQQRGVMCFNPMNANEMFLIAEMDNSVTTVDHVLYKYTYVSGDGTGSGGIWENRSANLPDTPCVLQIGTNFDFATWRSQNGFDLCITHHPTQEALYIGGINIHRSTSAFQLDDEDWIGGYRCNIEQPTNYSYPNHHSDQHVMVFSRVNPNVMWSANDGGIYRTDDALADSVAWIPLNHGYLTTQFYTVAMEQGHATSDFVFGGMQDNGTWITHTTDTQADWKEVHADDGAYCALPEGRDFILTSSQLGRIYKKTINDQGQLTNTERIDPTSGPSYLFINPFILDSQTHDDIWMAGNRTIWHLPAVSSIEVTGDYINKLELGIWDNVSESIIPVSAGPITTLDQSIIDNTKLFYASSNGRAWMLDSIFVDPVRTEITSDLWPNNAYASCISVNDLNTDELMISFANYNVNSIFHSLDQGETWVDVSGNLEENPNGTGAGPAVYWVEIYPSTPQIYFAATSAGLYSTSLLDGMNTLWEMEGAETIGNIVVNMIKARPFDGKIAIGTHANGIFTSSLPPVEAASVSNVSIFSSDVKVFPNPFNDQVSWNFTTKKDLLIQLDVFDLQGRKVHTENLAKSRAGAQNLNWRPTRELPKGTYLYKLSVGDIIKTGKIIHQ